MTRASKLASATWHEHKLQNVLPVRSLDSARRSFPYCIIDDWKSLPIWFFNNGFTLSHLQTFKVRVHKFLGGQTVLNPALARLRGRRYAADVQGDVQGVPVERLNKGFVAPRVGLDAQRLADLAHA